MKKLIILFLLLINYFCYSQEITDYLKKLSPDSVIKIEKENVYIDDSKNDIRESYKYSFFIFSILDYYRKYGGRLYNFIYITKYNYYFIEGRSFYIMINMTDEKNVNDYIFKNLKKQRGN